MGIIFEDDEVIRCDACGDEIGFGDTYQIYTHNNKTYCVCNYEDCKSNLLFKIYGDYFEQRKRYSKSDYLEIWEGLS